MYNDDRGASLPHFVVCSLRSMLIKINCSLNGTDTQKITKKTENRENRIVLAQEALLVLPILQLLVELHKNIKLYRPY